MATKKLNASTGYFTKSMQAILKKGEEKPVKKPTKSTSKRK